MGVLGLSKQILSLVLLFYPTNVPLMLLSFVKVAPFMQSPSNESSDVTTYFSSKYGKHFNEQHKKSLRRSLRPEKRSKKPSNFFSALRFSNDRQNLASVARETLPIALHHFIGSPLHNNSFDRRKSSARPSECASLRSVAQKAPEEQRF